MRKYALYILILIALVGLFSPAGVVQAQTPLPSRQTAPTSGTLAPGTPGTGTTPVAATSPAGDTPFQKAISDEICWLGITEGIDPWGCTVQFFYIIFYTLPAYLLWASAQFFNVLIFITLGSQLLTGSTFIAAGWEIVRDLSNIFFILILLYIAIKVILGLGGSDVKKMIAQVVIMALLINFSMFMTGVVIDTSNILALIFYNKLSVTTVRNGQTVPIEYTPKLATKFGLEKDIAGAMTAAFDPTSRLTPEFFKAAGTQTVPGVGTVTGKPSVSILIGITVIAGALMFFAAYAFFVAGISFVGRLVELWVLIIFSPFAFMSSALPLLARTEYIGWDFWLKRLFKVSFMAPIFMFFMYFIFLLLHEGNPFGDIIQENGGAINTILLIFIPAFIILTLLLKATEFAKKGGGKLGELASTAGKMIGGLTVGAVTGGAALALRAGVGGGGGWLANKSASVANRLGAKEFNVLGLKFKGSALGANKLASGLTSVGALAQKSSFDVRGIKIGGQTLASATGISMGEAQKGGIEQSRKEKVEKRMKRAEMLKVREDEGLKQKLNKTEQDLQSLLNANSKELSELDKLIEKKRQELRDATARFGGGTVQAQQAGLDLQNIKDRKKALKDGINYLGDKDIHGAVTGANAKNYTGVNAGTYKDAAGVTHVRTINHLEDVEIRDRKQDISDEDRRRRVAFAKRTGRWWKGSANREAKHKIIMESKIESKGEK